MGTSHPRHERAATPHAGGDLTGYQRVQKVLAAAGVGSRRACEELISQGRVAVDGRPATLGDKADPRQSVITVDGERIPTNPDLVYWLLNKPRDVVTTADDPQGRPTVVELVPAHPRVYPVGRLDRDTEGLLLLTNDGELAHRLAHPSFEVPKTYLARVRGVPSKARLGQLTAGVELNDGQARAVSARVTGTSNEEALVEVSVVDGRKREVRRLLGAVDLRVQRLARVRLGPLELGTIAQGKFRPLTSQEVGALYAAVGLDRQQGGHPR
jgi:23S rRNA pseudouridine2605 synthase